MDHVAALGVVQALEVDAGQGLRRADDLRDEGLLVDRGLADGQRFLGVDVVEGQRALARGRRDPAAKLAGYLVAATVPVVIAGFLVDRYVPGGIQVNIGDMMERWTNDQWVSTHHRVLVPESPESRQQRRQAIAFFQMANYDAVIAPVSTTVSQTQPPQYEPIPAGEEMMVKISRQYSREGEAIEDLRERAVQQ